MIYVVTNRHLVDKDRFYDTIEGCASSGVQGIILREKDLSFDLLLPMAKKVKEITDRHNIPLIINGSAKVAKEINAYGVHYGFNAFDKSIEIGSLHLGLSVHSLDEAIVAQSLGADYILCGNIFKTQCKPGLRGRGPSFIESITKNVNIPVIAIGGIDENNLKYVIDTGATGVAIMSSAMGYNNSYVIKNLKNEINILKKR